MVTACAFLYGALLRYKDLKVLGKTSDNFSALLWSKIFLFLLLIGLHITATAVIVLGYSQITGLEWCSLVVEVLYILVLCFATRLLVKEHLARLSEVWYCHKLLYGLNIVTTAGIIFFF